MLVCLLSVSFGAGAQQPVTDSAIYRQSVSAARAQYMQQMGANSFLYNGTAYERYWNGVTGIPFFLQETFQEGTLLYDGTYYESVPLKYDMLRDEVISLSFDKTIEISLLSSKISSFTIDGHVFVRLLGDSTASASLHTGFYERIYQGKMRVFHRRESRIERSLNAEDKTVRFKEYHSYFIKKEGNYYLIGSSSDLQHILKDQRAGIRKILNGRDTNFRKDPAKAIVAAVGYYEQLKK